MHACSGIKQPIKLIDVKMITNSITIKAKIKSFGLLYYILI
jgi:hypothetical protein